MSETETETAPAPKKPDWQQIELDYRAGIKTLRQIGEENGVSHVAIDKRAKREEWTRDLSARIQARAETLVNKTAVNREVTKTGILLTEKKIIEAVSQSVADISTTHRALLERSITVSAQLMEVIESPEMEPEKRARMFKIVTDSMDTVIRLQRQAWGMDAKNGTREMAKGEDASGVVQLRAMVRVLAQQQKGAIAQGATAAQLVG